MRGSRGEWIVLAAVVVVLAGVSALIGNRGVDEARESRPNPSSYNPNGSGSKALYLWLQELGLRERRWEQPLTYLPAEATVLLVLGPPLPLDEQELEGLEAWVRRGGVLVLADDAVGGGAPGSRRVGPPRSLASSRESGEEPEPCSRRFPPPTRRV